jgi:phage shock protein C
MSGDYKRLYRSREERMISGVCGGIAEYFEMDPTVIRLIFVLLAMAGGPGLIAYIILAIIIPEKPVDYQAPSAPIEPPAPAEAAEPADVDEPEAEA